MAAVTFDCDNVA